MRIIEKHSDVNLCFSTAEEWKHTALLLNYHFLRGCRKDILQNPYKLLRQKFWEKNILYIIPYLKTLLKQFISERHWSTYICYINFSVTHLSTLIYTGSVVYKQYFYRLYTTKDKISEVGDQGPRPFNLANSQWLLILISYHAFIAKYLWSCTVEHYTLYLLPCSHKAICKFANDVSLYPNILCNGLKKSLSNLNNYMSL